MMGATATHTSSGAANTFGPLHQIDAGLLNVGYAEAGPAGGPAVNPCPPGGTCTFNPTLELVPAPTTKIDLDWAEPHP